MRLLTAPDVQENCDTTMLNLLRRRGDVLGLQLCVGTTGCAVQALEHKISKQVSDAVLACRKVWTGSSSFGLQDLQLLALTQKLPKVIRTVTSGVIPGISDGNAYEQILHDLHISLSWCLVRCFPGCDDPWYEPALKLVNGVA